MRVCLVPDCAVLTATARCPAHTLDRSRYGRTHATTRARWAHVVALGTVLCSRCHKPIDPAAEWDLGHDDRDPELVTMPEHRRCNRAAPRYAT